MTYWIAGTGTRKIQVADVAVKEKVMNDLTDFLGAALVEHDEVGVISGMAEGFDSALAISAVKLDIPFIACVPNRGYGEHYWGKKSLTGNNRFNSFHSLLGRAQEVEYTDEFYGVRGLYRDGIHMNFWRNQRMVDRADALVAYGLEKNLTDGGTADCVNRGRYKRTTHPDFEITFLAPAA